MEKKQIRIIGIPSEWIARLTLASSASIADTSEIVTSFFCKLASISLYSRRCIDWGDDIPRAI